MLGMKGAVREDTRAKLRGAAAFGLAHSDPRTPEGARTEQLHRILAGWE